MPSDSLSYLIDRHFTWALRPGDAGPDGIPSGPGIVLAFVEIPDQGAEYLVDALMAHSDVVQAAWDWLHSPPTSDQFGQTFVRYALLPDLRQRAELMTFVRMLLPGARYP